MEKRDTRTSESMINMGLIAMVENYIDEEN